MFYLKLFEESGKPLNLPMVRFPTGKAAYDYFMGTSPKNATLAILLDKDGMPDQSFRKYREGMLTA